jgi:hypothetical protein
MVNWAAVPILVLTLWGGYATFKQDRKIRCNPHLKGQSVSVTFFLFFAAIMPVQIIYGLEGGKWTLVFNGLVRFSLFSLLLQALWRSKGFSRAEKIYACLFALASLAGSVSSRRDLWFFMFCFGGMLFTWLPMRELYKQKYPGAVEPLFLWTSLLNVTFWFVYGMSIDDWTVWGVVPGYWMGIALTLFLYYRYKAKVEAQTQ